MFAPKGEDALEDTESFENIRSSILAVGPDVHIPIDSDRSFNKIEKLWDIGTFGEKGDTGWALFRLVGFEVMAIGFK